MLFRNLYMSDGMLFILSGNRLFLEIRMMMSMGLPAQNNNENIAMRELTQHPAKRWWGDRVLTVEGNTLLVNEPSQFLGHYFHLCAELFFGVQAFWHGAHSEPTANSESEVLTHPALPSLDRIIFAHATVDSCAVHRGPICGSQTQCIASKAWEYMHHHALLMGMHIGGWWEPVRSAVLRFAGAPISRSTMHEKPMPERVVITYISWQGGQQHRLLNEDHDGMVDVLEELVHQKNMGRGDVAWELNVLEAEGFPNTLNTDRCNHNSLVITRSSNSHQTKPLNLNTTL
ncbi:hypothetical protein IW261DRAFT_1652486 [Armillaria novae-zelandiae]|uniref:Uncharacterized protein n=1 Tax=Armillaria novae-zelandiae TaxID=153914 RepID=A0AA39PQ29_9AGAR|nr:hypothetical protein IW261DRAFT_1652486 [Armillaria novae-zelandiae]